MNAANLLKVWLVASTLALAALFNSGVQASAQPAIWQQEFNLKQNSPVNIAPWGEKKSWDNGKDIGIFWEDPRDVFRVVAVFDGAPPEPGKVRLQWWQSQWPNRRIPRDHLTGAGESGWLHIGDLYQGRWLDADAQLTANGNTWIYVMQPVNQKEFPRLRDFAAPYRTTLKLRLLFESNAPQLESLQVYSDAVWKGAEFAIEWGGTAQAAQNWDGHLEMFNGYVDRVQQLEGKSKIEIDTQGHWTSNVKGQTSGVRARVWFTESPNVNSFDKSIATVRARQHSFSFDVAEVASGERVFAPMYGVLVRRADDAQNYAGAQKQWKSRESKPIYERVFDEPEQTFARAWSEMPPKRQFYIPLGCEGGRQRFGVEPDGSVFCRNDRIDHPAGIDSPRRVWGGNSLHYRFGLPQQTPAKRWIQDDCLPIIHAQWNRDNVRYTQTAFATRFEPGSLGFPDMQADDTTVLMMRVTCENLGDHAATATLEISLHADGQLLELSTRDGLAFAKLQEGQALRYALDAPDSATVTAEDGKIRLAQELQPKTQTDVIIRIPFITLDKPEEIQRLQDMSFAGEFDRVQSFWRERADASCQIRTPVDEISNFYRAHVSHLLINCGREVGADRLMARVGSFGYGVYGNESCMMITDLDRRGLHKEAERCLETFLHYQGSVPLPGDYTTHEGVLYGARGWESGGYNQHHGWIMWAMAEHYWHSGDVAWLKRNADKLLKACDWIINQRARTKRLDPKGIRGIEQGLLPPGSLEDIGDWRCWLSNNMFSWWGLDAVAKALADINHPQAANLLAEAKAYHTDMMAAFKEAMVRSPLVRLRDGTYIPQIPSEVHRRGRTFGWITVTLEGAIYLIRTGALDPLDPLSLCIMQDFEDNLYLSEQYGYSPEHMTHWFSRGGFSMQPNLLCSPHPYLMRDEIEHFLRSYFNAFAVGYYPNTQMLTEHPLPDMGDWRGDHYKSSDESNSTYWLRLMFVDERDDEIYLGMAIPRAWLTDGCQPMIERAATRFGPMSLRFESDVAKGAITAVVAPQLRRQPAKAFLRIRHPESKPILRVEIDGKTWDKFDSKRELIQLPNMTQSLTVTAYY